MKEEYSSPSQLNGMWMLSVANIYCTVLYCHGAFSRMDKSVYISRKRNETLDSFKKINCHTSRPSVVVQGLLSFSAGSLLLLTSR